MYILPATHRGIGWAGLLFSLLNLNAVAAPTGLHQNDEEIHAMSLTLTSASFQHKGTIPVMVMIFRRSLSGRGCLPTRKAWS